MIEKTILAIQQQLPLKIDFNSWTGEALTISGEGWSFHTLGAWRIINKGKVEFACWDERARDEISGSLTADIIGVSIQGGQIAIDPFFELSNGKCLEVFTMGTQEPWVLTLPNGKVCSGALG